MSLTLLAVARSASALSPLVADNVSFSLEVVSDSESLAARLREGDEYERPAAIIVELHEDAIGPVGPVVRALRLRFPTTPLVVACTEVVAGRDLFHAVRAGAEHFAHLPHDDLSAILANLTAPFADVLELESQHAALVAGLPRPIGRVFDAILLAEHAPDSVAELATTVGISPRTFERRASRHGWPAPRQLLVWGRLVRGAAAVEPTADASVSSLDRLLQASGFPNAGRAARDYARCAGVTLTAVLENGMRALEPALLGHFGARAADGAVTTARARSSAA